MLFATRLLCVTHSLIIFTILYLLHKAIKTITGRFIILGVLLMDFAQRFVLQSSGLIIFARSRVEVNISSKCVQTHTHARNRGNPYIANLTLEISVVYASGTYIYSSSSRIRNESPRACAVSHGGGREGEGREREKARIIFTYGMLSHSFSLPVETTSH